MILSPIDQDQIAAIMHPGYTYIRRSTGTQTRMCKSAGTARDAAPSGRSTAAAGKAAIPLEPARPPVLSAAGSASLMAVQHTDIPAEQDSRKTPPVCLAMRSTGGGQYVRRSGGAGDTGCLCQRGIGEFDLTFTDAGGRKIAFRPGRTLSEDLRPALAGILQVRCRAAA